MLNSIHFGVFIPVLMVLLAPCFVEPANPPPARLQVISIKRALRVRNKHLCADYKMTCEPGEHCRVKVVMWPRVTVYPVCKRPRIRRARWHLCRLKPVVGNCGNATERWYYNVRSGLCSAFTYTGCGGNANNFVTKAMCLKKCTARRSYWMKRKRRRLWRWRNRRRLLRQRVDTLRAHGNLVLNDNSKDNNVERGGRYQSKFAAFAGSDYIQHRPLSMYRKSFRTGKHRKLFSLLRSKAKKGIGKMRIRVRVNRRQKYMNRTGERAMRWLVSTSR